MGVESKIMNAISFDTLAYSENMQKAGFTREQADAMAKANAEAFKTMITTQQLATKQDISEVKQDVLLVREELKTVKHELEKDISEVKHEIFKWMVTAMIAQTALLVGIIAFLK